MDAGGRIHADYLEPLCRCNEKGKFLHSLISKDAVTFTEHPEFPRLTRGYMFCTIFAHHDDETLLRILQTMVKIDENLDFISTSKYRWDQQDREQPRSLIDVVAKNGNLFLVSQLVNAGAKLTGDTLTWAILSKDEALVQYIFSIGARAGAMGSARLSPLGAAIRIQNHYILDLILSNGGLTGLKDLEQFGSALEEASWAGDANWVQRLIDIDTEALTKLYNAAIGLAINDGHEEIALTLIAAGADVNASYRLSLDDSYISSEDPVYNPLGEALKRYNAPLVRSLLVAGANPNLHGVFDHGEIFVLATEWGNHSVLQELIEASTQPISTRALLTAIKHRDRGLVDMLLHAGCSVSKLTEREIESMYPRGRYQSVLTAAVKAGDLELIGHVLDYGADPHDPEAFENSYTQDPAIVDLLLRKHVVRYPAGRREWGAELLIFSINDCNYSFFQKVLKAGADANQLIRLTTPLGHAIASSKRSGTSFLELLLHCREISRCSPETYVSGTWDEEYDLPRGPPKRRFGWHNQAPLAHVTAFHAAIGTGHRPTIELMLRHGANVNHPASFGRTRTPLQRAAELGDLETIDLLLQNGADINAPAALRGGGTALQLAAMQGFIPIVQSLLERGADVNAPASKAHGRTALEGAAEQGRLDMVAVLLNAGAGLNNSVEKPFTNAINLARKTGHGYIADMISRYEANGRLDTGPVLFDDLINWEPEDLDQD
ncbi:MAG: hypothetical protein Q9160_006377 [Pyrenula sp. 1 TL-2023]